MMSSGSGAGDDDIRGVVPPPDLAAVPSPGVHDLDGSGAAAKLAVRRPLTINQCDEDAAAAAAFQGTLDGSAATAELLRTISSPGASTDTAAAAAAVPNAPDLSANTAKLLSTLKEVDKSVKFNITVASELTVILMDFDGLAGYVDKVLTDLQGEEVYNHSGILCSIYQAQVSCLLNKGKSTDALAVLNEKVRPLLANDEDQFYKPKNLATQVTKIEKGIRSGELLPDTVILTLLLEYFTLYFPTLLEPERERTLSVFDFIGRVAGVEETRCLACRWVVPDSYEAAKLKKHYTGNSKVKRCFCVSEWMKSYLETLNTDQGTALLINAIGKTGAETQVKADKVKKKRKIAHTPSEIFIVSGKLRDGLLDLFTAICKLPPQLEKEVGVKPMAAASEVYKILTQLYKMTLDIILLDFKCFGVCDTLEPEEVASMFSDLVRCSVKLKPHMMKLEYCKRDVIAILQKAKEVDNLSMEAEIVEAKKSKSSVSGDISSADGANLPGAYASTPPSTTS